MVRFGLFEVDPCTSELRKQGRGVKLQEQPFQVLAALLERPGELVTREELRQRIWGSDTFVDFEHSLNKAVNKVRQALGDSADNPRFIETLARKGYRFIAPVEAEDAAEQTTSPVPEAALRQKGWRRLRPSLAVGVSAALAVAALGWLVTRPTELPKVLRFTQLTNNGMAKRSSVVSDGTWVYFSEYDGEKYYVGQVAASGGEVRHLPNPFTEQRQMFTIYDLSPDRLELLIGLGQWYTDSQSLWVLPVSGGPARRVGDLLVFSAAWSPDGRQILFARGNRLYITNNDGTSPRTLLEAAHYVWWPAWSPKRQSIRYSLFAATSPQVALWEADVDGGHRRPVFPGWEFSQWGGRWTPDGRYFLFQSPTDWNIWAAREQHGLFGLGRRPPVRLSPGPIRFTSPYPSLDGRRLFSVGQLRRGELLRWDAARKQWVPFLGGISADNLDFSRDGKWVTYVTYPEARLWRSRVDGSERLPLSPPSCTGILLPRWSPDGKRIAFMGHRADTRWKIHLVPTGGGAVEQLLSGDSPEADPNWSPDGQQIVFAPFPFQVAPEPSRVYVADVRTWQVSVLPGSEGLYSPRWSPDGRYILAVRDVAAKQQLLVRFERERGSWETLHEGVNAFPSWSRDGKSVYFLVGDSFLIQRLNLLNGKVKDVASYQPMGITGTPPTHFSHEGWWMGLAPDDSPLILRDLGSQEVYALDWVAP